MRFFQQKFKNIYKLNIVAATYATSFMPSLNSGQVLAKWTKCNLIERNTASVRRLFRLTYFLKL